MRHISLFLSHCFCVKLRSTEGDYIKITLYRLAKTQIISSLINAAKNGKKVTVQIELQAF
jgi:hypothetical protein